VARRQVRSGLSVLIGSIPGTGGLLGTDAGRRRDLRTSGR
jgi:hypothetical protein